MTIIMERNIPVVITVAETIAAINENQIERWDFPS